MVEDRSDDVVIVLVWRWVRALVAEADTPLKRVGVLALGLAIVVLVAALAYWMSADWFPSFGAWLLVSAAAFALGVALRSGLVDSLVRWVSRG